MEVKTFRPTKIEKRLRSCPILATQASNFYHGFYNTLDIFSPKIKDAKLAVVIIKVRSVPRMVNAGIERVNTDVV